MQLTCQSARRLGNLMCGFPAVFVYRGQTFRGQPVTAGRLLLCEDCAYALSHDLTNEVRNRKVLLEAINDVKHRLHCGNCDVNVYMTWDSQDPVAPNPGQFMYCPRCGTQAAYRIDPDQDYWDLIATAFPGMPVQLLQILHVEWPREDPRFQRFRDYVQHCIDDPDFLEEAV